MEVRVDELGEDPRVIGNAGGVAANATPSRGCGELFGVVFAS